MSLPVAALTASIAPNRDQSVPTQEDACLPYEIDRCVIVRQPGEVAIGTSSAVSPAESPGARVVESVCHQRCTSQLLGKHL